jgi:hypothetical protein
MKVLAIKITPTYCATYQIDSTKSRSKLQELTCIENFEKAYTQGIMTGNVSRKIKDKLLVWLTGIYNEQAYRRSSGLTTNEYPTFLTLTLSKEQQHSDNWIKRELLGRFIELLKSKHGVVNYYWRAEKKAGKRIHFHLILDRFVSWKLLRLEWNYLQVKHGYHDEFMHSSSNFGCNSIDIDSIKNSEQCAKYITKYVSKDEDNDPIEGRIWGCSSALHTVGNCTRLATAELQPHIVRLLNNKLVQVKSEESHSLYTWSKEHTLKTISYELFKIYNQHCADIYRSLYYNKTVNFAQSEIREGIPRFQERPKNVRPTTDDRMQFQYTMTRELFDGERKMLEFEAFDAIV